MKISGSFFTMLIIWLLGFTHFLSGPYLLFRAIFWLALLPFFIAIFFLLIMFFKTRKLFKDLNNTQSQNQEIIYVDAEIKG